MDSEKLYRVQEEDLSKLEELLCRSFAADPLYVELIPDEEVRKRLMPELFQCDLTEFYETCEIFADSKDLNGILVVSDETEPYHLLHRYFTEVQATLRTEGYLIREDHSLKTFFNFELGRDYLNSSWTDQLIRIGDCISFIWRLIRKCSITESRRRWWKRQLHTRNATI